MENSEKNLFLNNILSYFVFYLPDDMVVVDKNVYYYNGKYYTDDVNLRGLYTLVTNDWRFKSNNSVYLFKFRYFRGNDFPEFYDKYTFTTGSWFIKKNFESSYVEFNEGNCLSVTLLFNLICRSLNCLKISNIDIDFVPQITYICKYLNLDFDFDENSVIIFNMYDKLDRSRIVSCQDFSEYSYNIFSSGELAE